MFDLKPVVFSLSMCGAIYNAFIIILLLWFRNDILQFSSPEKTTLPLTPPFPSNWKHKRHRTQAETTTIYWKQQWDKQTSNSNNINNKRSNTRKLFTQKALHNTTSSSPPHFLPLERTPFSSEARAPYSHPGNEVRCYRKTSKLHPFSHTPSQVLPKT